MKQVEDKERLLVEMLCKWCGKETPDDSAFCESCGKALSGEAYSEQAEGPADAVDDTSSDDAGEGQASAVDEDSSDSVDEEVEIIVDEEAENAIGEKRDAAGKEHPAGGKLSNAAEEAVSDKAPDAFEPWLTFGTPAGSPLEFGDEESAANIPEAIKRTKRDEPLVDPPTPPNQPNLGASRTVVVATVAVLFAAALILLTCVILMRVLGL